MRRGGSFFLSADKKKTCCLYEVPDAETAAPLHAGQTCRLM